MARAGKRRAASPAKRKAACARAERPPRVASPPAIIIHSLAHARAALAAAAAAGIEVELWSAPGAAAYAGSGWFRAVIAAARRAVPMAACSSVLDCGDLPGLVLNACRVGLEGVCFTGSPRVARKLADIAAKSGVRLHRRRPAAALDLRAADSPVSRCREWLERGHR